MSDETTTTRARAIRTCRMCKQAFTKSGYGAQSGSDPKRCRDCVAHEAAFGGAPGYAERRRTALAGLAA